MAETKKEPKSKPLSVRFDLPAYDRISKYAKAEHRGMSEFVRHVVLSYIEERDKTKDQ